MFQLPLNMSVVQQQEGMTDLIPCNEQCGGDYENYSFSQTDKEVNVMLALDAGVTSKMLAVDIQTNTLSVGLKGKPPVLCGKLFRPIKASESMWFIQDRKTLVVTLAKTNLKYEEWWPHVVEGERQIDMKTLRPPEVHLSELDEGAQAKVHQMMFDQQQRRAGKPTSDQLRLGLDHVGGVPPP